MNEDSKWVPPRMLTCIESSPVALKVVKAPFALCGSGSLMFGVAKIP